MAVSKKNKRRIVVDGAPYLWWVAEDENSPLVPFRPALTIVSEDGRVYVRYHLDQPADLRHVTVLGRSFRSVPGCGGVWRRFLCPAFGAPGEIRPRDVEAFVRWVAEPGESPVEVDYQGRPI